MSAKDRLQNTDLKQFKLNLTKISKEDEKIGTKFEPPNHEDVVSKAYSATNSSNVKGNCRLEKNVTTTFSSIVRNYWIWQWKWPWKQQYYKEKFDKFANDR